MKPLEVPESNPTPANTPEAKIDTSALGKAIQALLASDAITDPTDKSILEGATSFLGSPTCSKDISGITKHSSDVAQVMAGYDMQGAEVPRVIDAMYLQLTLLEYRFHSSALKAELQQASPGKAKMQKSMQLALGVAKILAKGYQNDSVMSEVQELQLQIDQL